MLHLRDAARRSAQISSGSTQSAPIAMPRIGVERQPSSLPRLTQASSSPMKVMNSTEPSLSNSLSFERADSAPLAERGDMSEDLASTGSTSSASRYMMHIGPSG